MLEHSSNDPNPKEYEAESKTQYNNGKGEIEKESLLPVVDQSVLKEIHEYKTTENPYSQENQSNPFRQWLSRISIQNSLLVVCNSILAAVAIFQLIAIDKQAGIMKTQSDLMDGQLQVMKETLDEARASGKEASEQSKRLIIANEKLAEAASQQANSAAQAVGASKASADAAKQSVLIANDALRIGTAPIISITGYAISEFKSGSRIGVRIAIQNVGETVALRFRGRTTFILSPKELVDPPEPASIRGIQSHSDLAPQQTRYVTPISDFKVDQSVFDAINSGKIFLYVYGRYEFDDRWGKPHWKTFCAVYQPITKEFADYSKFNEQN